MAPIAGGVSLPVESMVDAEAARRAARALASSLGAGTREIEAIVLAVSELAVNLARYAIHGELYARPLYEPGRVGVEVETTDRGPGIPDLARALDDGFSTGGGMGSGLPAVRRLMDEFEIESGPAGTCVRARKWLKPRPEPTPAPAPCA